MNDFFGNHKKKNYVVHVNLHIVKLDKNGYMKCTCEQHNAWGMPCPMKLSIAGELSPLMFYSRWHKACESEFNSSNHPKIKDSLQDMLKINRDNEGDFFVTDIANIEKHSIHECNIVVAEDK